MRRAHKDVDSAVIGGVQHTDDFPDIPKADGLRPRFFLARLRNISTLWKQESQEGCFEARLLMC